MTIERTDSEVIIKVSSNINLEGLQGLIDFLKYKEVTQNSTVRQSEVDELVSEVKSGWWAKNRSRLIK